MKWIFVYMGLVSACSGPLTDADRDTMERYRQAQVEQEQVRQLCIDKGGVPILRGQTPLTMVRCEFPCTITTP